MFRRTQNDNGTFNTLCLDCMMTVALGVDGPPGLAAVERKHMCVEKALVQLFQASQTGSVAAGISL